MFRKAVKLRVIIPFRGPHRASSKSYLMWAMHICTMHNAALAGLPNNIFFI